MKSLIIKTLTLTAAALALASCASKQTDGSGTGSEAGAQDPREMVKNAVAKEQKNLDRCFHAPGKKDEYFVGRLTYDIEFNNKIVTSTKLVEDTFQTPDLKFETCVEKAIKGIQLESQKENLPYNIRYPFSFGMDRE